MWIREFPGDKGWMIAIHGLGEHSKRYNWLAELLQQIGYGLTLFDLPGHGESPGVRGYFAFSQVFQLLDDFFKAHPNSVLFGHSLGGLIAIRYAELRNGWNIKSLVVTSPALRLPNDSLFNRLLAVSLSFLAPSLTLDNGIDPNLLSTNKDAVKRYVEDPLVHRRISVKLAHDMFVNLKKAITDASKISLPCFVAVGSDDKITLPEGAKEFYQKISSNEKMFREYKGCFHEIFEDESVSSVFKNDLINWLKEH